MDGPVASEGGFPVRSKAFATDVGGVNTDFFYSVYADRILVVVTQVGTTGTIISARQDASAETSGSETFSTSVLMGRRDEPLLSLCARRIVEDAAAVGCTLPLVICLGLETHSIDVVRQVAATVAANNVWSASPS